MVRRFFLSSFGFLSAVAVLSAAVLSFFKPTAESFFLAVAVASLITVARASPAPTRSFLKRLMSRTRDPVPSTI